MKLKWRQKFLSRKWVCVRVIEKLLNLIFWQIFGICNFDFVFLWHGIWCESPVWVIMGRRRVSQNEGILVLVISVIRCGAKLLTHSQSSGHSHWSLGIDKYFHLALYWACDYSSMLGLSKWNNVCKRYPGFNELPVRIAGSTVITTKIDHFKTVDAFYSKWNCPHYRPPLQHIITISCFVLNKGSLLPSAVMVVLMEKQNILKILC